MLGCESGCNLNVKTVDLLIEMEAPSYTRDHRPTVYSTVDATIGQQESSTNQAASRS
jgi:hypothetical protein